MLKIWWGNFKFQNMGDKDPFCSAFWHPWTRPDENGEQVGRPTLHSGSSKNLVNSCFRKQGATPANFMLCYQKIFVPINIPH